MQDLPEPHRHRPIVKFQKLDVENYAELYRGRTKVYRLIIADRCEEESMRLDALRMAYDESKRGEDTRLFKEIISRINGRLGPNYGLDGAWVEEVNRKATRTEGELRTILLLQDIGVNADKENLVRRSSDLGDFYYARGQLEDAMNSYSNAIGYCRDSWSALTGRTYMKSILICIDEGQFASIVSRADMAKQTEYDPDDSAAQDKLTCAIGLAHLEENNYKAASCKFLQTGPWLDNQYNEVIALHPKTLGHMVLCARLQLSSVQNLSFKCFIGLVPGLEDLINDFYHGHYDTCMDYLANLKANLVLDIHLHDHVEALYTQIRENALLHYTLPYVSVDLHRMATAFKSSVIGMEKELEALIADGKIQASIDSVGKVLNFQPE